MKSTFCKRLTAWMLAAVTGITCSVPTFAKTYNDMERITSHVSLRVSSELQVYRPEKELTTSAAGYLITGGSNPDQKLTVNGKEVTSRGARGSFGVYVQLQTGVNPFTFRQSGQEVTVNITRGADTVTTISTMRRMQPEFDCAVMAGGNMTLGVEAPSGAQVTATVAGKNLTLQQPATASEGVPAQFTAQMQAPSVQKTTDYGPVTYTMRYKGKTTSLQSVGRVLVANGQFVAQVKNNASCIYPTEAMTEFQGIVKQGAVDYVTEVGKSAYRLSSGSWIPKESVTPLAGNVAVKNQISEVDYTVSQGGETLTLTGRSHPIYYARQGDGKLTIQLMNTSGMEMPNISGSKLYDDLILTENGGHTTIEFVLSGKKSLWGYDVSYKNGVTTIYSKYKPAKGSDGKPLSGITIAVDPGHGGSDPGALGVAGTNGPSEAAINLATAIALQKRLESLGANVLMTRTDEVDLSMNDRMAMTRREDADFFISLHSNSVGLGADSERVSGVEVYYYYGNSKKLATNAAANLAEETGRSARGAKFSNYRVTLNSFCPSVLVEMGFLTNAREYDNMTTKTGIFRTVNAIADSVVASL